MPSRFIVRQFEENAFYHIFNRGVEKREIFLDSQDYNIFTYYLFIYLKPLDKVLEKYPRLPLRLQPKNLASEVLLVSYCLMPNHFHLLLKQNTKNGVSRFMKQLTNAYTEYFNKKYERTGSLMQGRFKAVRVKTDEQLIHLSRYIHLNPLIAGISRDLQYYLWSSYKGYLKNDKNDLFTSSPVLNLFKNADDYKRFVEDQINYAKDLKKLADLTIES